MINLPNKNIIKRQHKYFKIFDMLNYMLLGLLMVSIIYPFLYLLSRSLSDPAMTLKYGLKLFPSKITFDSYRRVVESVYILKGYLNTIIRVLGGTSLTLVFACAMSYPLSKKYFPNRVFWTSIIVFTMFFSGGMIPGYLLIKNLNLIDSRWALILPALIPTYSMFIMRNYFMSLPESLVESGKIDGANDIHIFVRIILPMSKPILATVALWTAVWHWNAWFDCLLYITDQDKVVLQVVLRRILLEGTMQMVNMNLSRDMPNTLNSESIKAAVIFVATVPILMVYPFVQKYFIKGIMIGSLKG